MEKENFQDSIKSLNEESNEINRANYDIINEKKNCFLKNKKIKLIILAIISGIIMLTIVIAMIISVDETNCELKEVKDGKEFYFCKFDNGDTYEGELKNNKRNGEGLYIYNDKSYYLGEWKDNQMDGEGIFVYTNGNMYMGNWKNGKKTEGNYYFKTSGNFLITLFYHDGDVYEGEFKDGKFNGKGIYKYKSGNVYEGDFKDNKFEGKGIFKFKCGDIYNGEFKNNKFEGKGIYIWKNGNNYDGEWKNGKKHGEGTLTEIGFLWNTVTHGIWEEDKLIKKIK